MAGTRRRGGTLAAAAALVLATTVPANAQQSPSGVFSPGVPVAYIVANGSFADGLAGGPAAARQGGPILLSGQASLPGTSVDELVRLRPERIVVLGGAAVISEEVVAQLGFYTTGTVTRVAGPDRYSTAAALARAVFTGSGGPVYVATGADWPDSLSGGAAAAHDDAPLLLVRPHSIPEVTAVELARLAPSRIVLLGGLGSVSTGVEDALRAQTGAPVVRLSGPTRYDTAARISAATFSPGMWTVYVASGERFSDALVGVPAAAMAGSPILLLRNGQLAPEVAAELERLGPERLVILGNTAAQRQTQTLLRQHTGTQG